jgi:iron complex transport system substrate-binding protein
MKIRSDLFSLALSLSIALLHPSTAAAWTVKDGSERVVEIKDASRIVTIGGSVTEIVYALGFGDKIVAIDITSSYPAEVKSLPSIGYMRALAPEGVISLGPTLVLAIEGSGPKDAVEVLSSAAVPFVLVPDGYDEDSVLKKIRFIAAALGVPEKGEQMAKTVAEDFVTAKALLTKHITTKRNAMFVLSTGNGTPTVAGTQTSADGIMKLAHVQNAMTTVSGFKPATPEATLAAQPEVIVMLLERSLAVNADTLFALPAFAATPAAKDKRLVSISSYYLTFGPRTAHAMRDFAAMIYPELNLPQMPSRPWTASVQSQTK